MPYAIYQLKVNGVDYPEFHSYAKDRPSLYGDLVKYLHRHVGRLNAKSPQTDAKLSSDMNDIAQLLNLSDLTVVEEIGATMEHQLDVMLQFLGEVKRLKDRYGVTDYQPLANKLGDIEFGVRKVLARRMDAGYKDLPFETRREDHSQFNWYYAKVEVITALLVHQPSNKSLFDKTFDDMVSAVMQSNRVNPLTS